ncbi:hypothetical protein ACR6C2_44445 [Streptomyces sp. INA 01156]
MPAADGHDTAACSDGNCEIAVSEPVTVRFDGLARHHPVRDRGRPGPDRVRTEVRQRPVQERSRRPGQVCLTVLRSHGSSTSCGGKGDGRPPAARPGAVVIRAATGEDGTALLHVVSD